MSAARRVPPWWWRKARTTWRSKSWRSHRKATCTLSKTKPLAQALYKTVDVGEEIPEEFYKAVAEVLAYIYRLKQAGRS